jgi:hypothetical protein
LKARAFLFTGLVLALGLVLASASAGNGTFKPKVGEYKGTLTGPAGNIPTTGTVTKKGTKYTVQPLVGGQAECQSGLKLTTVPMGIVVPLKGKAFSATEKVIGPNALTFQVKVSGHFTSEKAFTGVASASSVPNPSLPTQDPCTVSPVKFSMKAG